MLPTTFLPKPQATNRPTLNLPPDTIEQATTTGDARRIMVPQDVPTWLVGQVAALAEASEKDHQHLTERYGEEVANLLAPNRPTATMAEDTAIMLTACEALAGAGDIKERTEFLSAPHAQTPLHHLGLALSIEISLFSEKLTDHPLKNLGTRTDYGLYHKRSQTFIPIICERGIITTVDYDLFTNGTELAAEAVRLIEAYSDIAQAEGREPLSRVGFYTHGWDAKLGNVIQCKVIDTSLF